MIKLDDLIGVPFANRGRDPETGLDCYGLVMEVYRRYGYDIPEYDMQYHYEDMCRVNELIQGNSQNYPWKEISEPEVPCLMAIRFGSPEGVVNHTAVYIGDDCFIHARERVGVCVDRLSSPAWSRVIVGFYKYVGDMNGDTGNR